MENSKHVFTDEFICLISKASSFNCGSDNKRKMKGISKCKLKNNNFEVFYKSSYEQIYQKECDNNVIRSNNIELYLQLLRKATLSQFDEKRCNIIETESVTRN